MNKKWKLFGQYKKDIDSARKLADKEYKKQEKARTGSVPNLRTINTKDKLFLLIKKSLSHHPQIKFSEELFDSILEKLRVKRLIDTTLYSHVMTYKKSYIKQFIQYAR